MCISETLVQLYFVAFKLWNFEKIEQTAVFANCTLNSSGATLACSRLGNSVSKRFESPNLEQKKGISVRESHEEARSWGGEWPLTLWYCRPLWLSQGLVSRICWEPPRSRSSRPDLRRWHRSQPSLAAVRLKVALCRAPHHLGQSAGRPTQYERGRRQMLEIGNYDEVSCYYWYSNLNCIDLPISPMKRHRVLLQPQNEKYIAFYFWGDGEWTRGETSLAGRLKKW